MSHLNCAMLRISRYIMAISLVALVSSSSALAAVNRNVTNLANDYLILKEYLIPQDADMPHTRFIGSTRHRLPTNRDGETNTISVEMNGGVFEGAVLIEERDSRVHVYTIETDDPDMQITPDSLYIWTKGVVRVPFVALAPSPATDRTVLVTLRRDGAVCDLFRIRISAPRIESIEIVPLPKGSSSRRTVKVTLDAPAGKDGILVKLKADGEGVWSLPPAIRVAENEREAYFCVEIRCDSPEDAAPLALTAIYNDQQFRARLTLSP